MKKVFATLMCLLILSFAVVPADAQTRRQRSSARQSAQTRYDDDRSVWERSRDKITTGGGAVGGAIIGGLIGGKKGAVIGAITGGAGAAVYTYKVRKKDDYRRY
jgi:outer membrane lipoprotein SlyB